MMATVLLTVFQEYKLCEKTHYVRTRTYSIRMTKFIFKR